MVHDDRPGSGGRWRHHRVLGRRRWEELHEVEHDVDRAVGAEHHPDADLGVALVDQVLVVVRAVDEGAVQLGDVLALAHVLTELLPVGRDRGSHVVGQLHVVKDVVGGSHVAGPPAGDGGETAVSDERRRPLLGPSLVGQLEELLLVSSGLAVGRSGGGVAPLALLVRSPG